MTQILLGSNFKVSPETVMRDWRAAKAWLERELEVQP